MQTKIDGNNNQQYHLSQYIQQFVEAKKIAIAGVSRNKKKFGNIVFRTLQSKGYEIFPINPNAEIIDNVKCYSTVQSLPNEVKHLLVITKKNITTEIVKASIEKQMNMVWLQQLSESIEAIDLLEKHNIPCIYNQCILMHAQPSGIHKFHRFLYRLFGKLPK